MGGKDVQDKGIRKYYLGNRNRIVYKWKVNIDYKYFILGYLRQERYILEFKVY